MIQELISLFHRLSLKTILDSLSKVGIFLSNMCLSKCYNCVNMNIGVEGREREKISLPSVFPESNSSRSPSSTKAFSSNLSRWVKVSSMFKDLSGHD